MRGRVAGIGLPRAADITLLMLERLNRAVLLQVPSARGPTMGSTVIRLVTVMTIVTLVALGGLALPVAAEETCDPACVRDPARPHPR